MLVRVACSAQETRWQQGYTHRVHKLSDAEIEARLSGALAENGWGRVGDSIQRTYSFADFAASMHFVNRLAAHAEAVQHHPNLLIRYAKVTVTLDTHDVGGISERDFAFASAADALRTA